MENDYKSFTNCASNRRKALVVSLFSVFLAISLHPVTVNCVPVKEIILKIPALESIFHLRPLYDARNGSFTGLSILNSSFPTPLVTTTDSPQINTESKIFSEESDKFNYTRACADGCKGQECAAVINTCAPRYRCLNGSIICVDGINSYSCACADGFTGNECQHVNACRYNRTCKSVPANGNCHRCRDGFFKDPEDDLKCKFANSNASLIISSQYDIRMISLDDPNATQMIQNRDYFLGTDYNFRANTIFWFSNSDKKIYTAAINAESGKKSIFHDSLSRINGVAVDWIHEHLYWVDWGRKEICVSNLNGTMRKVLFTDEISLPHSIVVNPLSGWMYWSDRQLNRIERAGLDGSRRKVILTTNQEFSAGLVVDFVDSRLYWSQGRDPSSIWSSHFDGLDSKLLYTADQSHFSLSVFSQIATFDNYVYFIEYWSKTIYRVNKCNEKELAMIHKSKVTVWDIKIYDANLQPEGENLCSKRIGHCSYFCFPVPSPGNGSVSTTTCACPDGLSLSADQQDCV